TISHMNPCKQDGLNNSCRPETDSVSQGVKEVAAQHVFFKKANQQKDGKPEKPPTQNLCVQRGDVTKIESMHHTKDQQQESKRKKSPQEISPHKGGKGRTLQWQAVSAHLAVFDPAHDPGEKQKHQKHNELADRLKYCLDVIWQWSALGRATERPRD